jgi:type IV pilus assembly protein PilM
LAKQDELSSTERLLELIRDERPTEPTAEEFAAFPPARQRFKNYLSKSLAFRKKIISVGVDLGHEDLKIVAVNRISDRKVELMDYARVAFDSETHRDHPNFHQFLHSALVNVLGSHANVELWATIPSARVETRYLKIPKLPQKQIANSIFWTYQKQSAFNDKETIFDYELLGNVEEGGVEKIAALAYIAPRSEVEDLGSLFAKAGFPLTGISTVPFAVQTLLRAGRIPSEGAALSSLYIGRDWSRIDIFANDNLVLSRGIKAGIRTMVEALQREIEQNWFELSMAKSPTSDQNRIRAIKVRLRQELEGAQNLFFSPIYGDAPAEPDDKKLAVKEDRIFQMILPALERLVRQIERTIRHFALNFDNARVEKIFVSSGVRPHPRILHYIGDELGLPIEVINPFVPDGDFQSLTEIPESPQKRSAFVPAMGMALANNDLTPNFFFTYKEKNNALNARRISRGVFAALFVLVFALAGFALWQERQIKDKDFQKLSLQKQLAGYEVRVDQNLILKLVEQIRTRNQNIQGIGNNFLGVAVLGEVANMTPANVRLISINARLEGPATPAAGGKPGSKPGAAKKVLVVDGVILGDRSTLESDLATYLMTLKNSPLFKEAAISKKSLDMMDNQPVMRFTAQMDVV